MPYRIELDRQPTEVLDALVGLGALDADVIDGDLIAIIPDEVTTAEVAKVLGHDRFRVGPVRGRDDDSVWLVRPSAVRVGSIQIVPEGGPVAEHVLSMEDGPAFGTGHHPTTALCLEAIEADVRSLHPSHMLDVGTGSGVLALAALVLGVRRAVAVDTSMDAVATAARNARRNGLASRLHLVCSSTEPLAGQWPLVAANILAAPLVEMAPSLARLVDRKGRLVLSGVRSSLAPEVTRAYVQVGMHRWAEWRRDGWSALVFQASW